MNIKKYINEKVKEILKNEFKTRNTNINEKDLKTICNACIKYTMLNVSKNKIVNFNLDNATSFTRETGIYILYSIVRMNSILKTNKISSKTDIKFINDIENKIINMLYKFPEIIEDLLTTYEPSHLTKYIFNLTQEFSKLYENININNEPDNTIKASRIRLLNCTKIVLENALNILGISTVEKM